jgi:hypothetical protein
LGAGVSPLPEHQLRGALVCRACICSRTTRLV